MFQQPKRPFYFFFCITTRRYLCDFLLLVSCSYLDQLVQLSQEKSPSFIVSLSGLRADNTKQILLDSSFSLSKKQKIIAAEE